MKAPTNTEPYGVQVERHAGQVRFLVHHWHAGRVVTVLDTHDQAEALDHAAELNAQRNANPGVYVPVRYALAPGPDTWLRLTPGAAVASLVSWAADVAQPDIIATSGEPVTDLPDDVDPDTVWDLRT